MPDLIEVALPLPDWAKVVVALRCMNQDDYTDVAESIKFFVRLRPKSSDSGSEK